MMYRKTTTRQRIALIALLAATATVVTLDFRENPGGPVRRVQDAAISVVAPLQDGISRIFRPITAFLNDMSELPGLRAENARLKEEKRKLEEQQRRLPEILREHEKALQLLQQQDWATGSSLGARVIGVGPSNHESSRFIDKGSKDEVKVGMAAVASEGLVGRVVWVGAGQSKVLLIIDPEHSVGARLTGSGETGVVTGRSRDDLRFELIDPETAVEVGETVVTSGYDFGIYPPGIPIGRVTRVQVAADGLTKTAFVNAFVDFSRLDLIKILLESGPKEQPPGEQFGPASPATPATPAKR